MAGGKRNSAGAIMLALLAERARAETDRLRERINSGLAEARRKGVTLGRKVGKHDGAGSGAGSTQGYRAATQGRAEHPQRGYPDRQGRQHGAADQGGDSLKLALDSALSKSTARLGRWTNRMPGTATPSHGPPGGTYRLAALRGFPAR